jgi:hypothetical protein
MADQVDDGTKPGDTVTFPFDLMTIDQFRARFPRARWSDDRKAWFVPGKTATRRIGRWLAKLEAAADAHADAKGRDAFEFEFEFEFDPIESPYLERGKAGFARRRARIARQHRLIEVPHPMDQLSQDPFRSRGNNLAAPTHDPEIMANGISRPQTDLPKSIAAMPVEPT